MFGRNNALPNMGAPGCSYTSLTAPSPTLNLLSSKHIRDADDNVMTTTQPTSLLDLPVPLLSNVLCFLALEDQPESFCAALLVCKSMHRAGEAADRSRLQLRVSSTKLQLARKAGQEVQLLAFLRRTAHIWRRAAVAVDKEPPEQELQQLLRCLAPSSGNGLRALKLRFGGDENCDWIGIPKELTALTTLTALTIQQRPYCVRLPAAELASLSALTALRSLKLDATFSHQLPHQAFNQLHQLTRLDIEKWHEFGADPYAELSWGHLSACGELCQLHLDGVVPCLSGEQALAVWQHLEQLSIWPACSCAEAGFWHVLPQLASLTKLAVSYSSNEHPEPSQLLSNALPACSRLADLMLDGYNRPALLQLPTTLTSLCLTSAGNLRELPSAPMLHSLRLRHCQVLGAGGAALMPGLTFLQLMDCGLEQLPGPLAALPAVVVLDLCANEQLSELPPQLACLPCLRELQLGCCNLCQVPPVLGGGLATRLERFGLSYNRNLAITNEGLEVLGSLTALTSLDVRDIGQVELVEGLEAVRKVLPASCVLDS